MKTNNIFNKGDSVQSLYRAHWHGIVLGVNHWSTYENKYYPCYDVLALESVDGRKHRKPQIHVLSEKWLITSPRKCNIPENYKNYKIIYPTEIYETLFQ